MGIFAKRKKEAEKNESPIITAIRDAHDSPSLAAALQAFYNSNDPALCTADNLDLLLQKSDLCTEVLAASWYGCAFAFFCREPEGRDIATPRLRVRDMLFDLALRFCTTADCVRCLSQAFCNYCLVDTGKTHMSTPEGRKVFKHLACHATTGDSIRYLCTFVNNCATIEVGKNNFGHDDFIDGIILVAEHAKTPESVQWMTSAIANVCMLPEPRKKFFRDDFIQAISRVAIESTAGSLSSEAMQYYFVMCNNLTLTEDGRMLFVNDTNGKQFHDGIIRLANELKTDLPLRYLCATICNVSVLDEGKLLFASEDAIKAFGRCAPFVSDILSCRYFATAISNINSAVSENKKKFACPEIVKAIITISRVVYYSRESKFTDKDRAEAVRWINSAVSNIAMITEGQLAFGCPEYADCWGRLAAYAKENTSARFSLVALNNIGICPHSRKVFATDTVVDGFRAMSHFVEQEDSAQYFGSAIANLCIDDDCKKAFARPSMIDAFIRAARGATNPTAVHYLCLGMSNTCTIEGAGRDVFPCPEMVQEFLAVLAPNATNSISAQWLVSLISNTTLTKKARSAYQIVGRTTADIFFAVAPYCRDPTAVRYFCTSLNNICIEADCRKYFTADEMIKVYTMFAQFVTTRESARYYCQSLHNCVLGKAQQAAYAQPGLKNALCAAVYIGGSAFLVEPEGALWFINFIDVMFADPPNRAVFRTTTFRRAFKEVSALALKSGDAQVKTKIDRCTGDLETGYDDGDFQNDDDMIGELIQKIATTKDPVPSMMARPKIYVGDEVEHAAVANAAAYDEYDDDEEGVDDDYTYDDDQDQDQYAADGKLQDKATNNRKQIESGYTPPTNNASYNNNNKKRKSDVWFLELCEKHQKQVPAVTSIPQESIDVIVQTNQVTPATFLLLEEADLKAMDIPLGPRLAISQLLKQEKANYTIKTREFAVTDRDNNDDDEGMTRGNTNDSFVGVGSTENVAPEKKTQTKHHQQNVQSSLSRNSADTAATSSLLPGGASSAIPASRCFHQRGESSSPSSFKLCLTNALTILQTAPPGRPDLVDLIPTPDDLETLLFYIENSFEAVKKRPAVQKLIIESASSSSSTTTSITDDEIKALMCYQLEDPYPIFKWVNGWLSSVVRDANVKTALGPFFTLMYRGMEKLPKKVVTEGAVVSRRVSTDDDDDIADRIQKGSKVSFWGFSSFTTTSSNNNNTNNNRTIIIYECAELSGVEMKHFRPEGVIADEGEVLPLCPSLFEVEELKSSSVGQQSNVTTVVSLKQMSHREIAYVVPSKQE